MTLYSFKGEYPTNLPERVILDSGFSVTALQEKTTSELSSLGFTSITQPSYNAATQELQWDGIKFNVINILSNNVDFDSFVSNFLSSALSTRLEDHTLTKPALAHHYAKFLNYLAKSTAITYSIGDLKNYIANVFGAYSYTSTDISDMTTLLQNAKIDDTQVMIGGSFYTNLSVGIGTTAGTFLNVDTFLNTAATSFPSTGELAGITSHPPWEDYGPDQHQS